MCVCVLGEKEGEEGGGGGRGKGRGEKGKVQWFKEFLSKNIFSLPFLTKDA